MGVSRGLAPGSPPSLSGPSLTEAPPSPNYSSCLPKKREDNYSQAFPSFSSELIDIVFIYVSLAKLLRPICLIERGILVNNSMSSTGTKYFSSFFIHISYSSHIYFGLLIIQHLGIVYEILQSWSQHFLRAVGWKGRYEDRSYSSLWVWNHHAPV